MVILRAKAVDLIAAAVSASIITEERAFSRIYDGIGPGRLQLLFKGVPAEQYFYF